MSESAAWVLTVPCNKGHNQVQSNFAVDLAGCPDSGEGTRAPGPIHLSPSRVIQKNVIERMVDERRGKEAWGHLLAANLAKDSSTGAKHICVSMWSFFFFFFTALLTWQEVDNQQNSGFNFSSLSSWK